jgi:LuxR family transcriptional regulator, maltose regulon positive regulatory protein
VRSANVTPIDPLFPGRFVPRRRLLDSLSSAGDHTVVLVCAPAGFGKTALLAHWVRSATSATAWVDVNPAENDPGRLVRAVLTSLTACPEVPADSALHELSRGASASRAASGFWPDVVEALDVVPTRIQLVLHDIHEVVAPAALECLRSLLVARPAGLRLVMCSRWDPPLPMYRLRDEGRLHEIRADQLRFTPNETGTFLRRSGMRVTRKQFGQVHVSTRGWPTGVRLAAAALRGAADPDKFLERFAASTRPVSDFLVGEVLAALPSTDRDVLSSVSIGEPVTAERAATLTGRADTGSTLDRLARDTGLVTRIRAPAATYSLHPMASAHLRAGHLSRKHAGGPGRPKLCSALTRVEAGDATQAEAGLERRPEDERPPERPPRLSAVERQVLVLLPSSMSVEEIAEELRRPATVVEARMRTIYRKLGVSSRRTAVRAAYERGLLR